MVYRACRAWRGWIQEAGWCFMAVFQTRTGDSSESIPSDLAVRRIRPRIRTQTAGKSLPVRWAEAERAGRRPQGKTEWKRDPSALRRPVQSTYSPNSSFLDRSPPAVLFSGILTSKLRRLRHGVGQLSHCKNKPYTEFNRSWYRDCLSCSRDWQLIGHLVDWLRAR